LGFIFQGFNLMPNLTARENIALPNLIDGRNGKAIAEKTEALLALTNLTHRASHRPGALSGGEQQRVAIARSLMNDPALILADEPTGNLDSGHSAEIWSMLRRLCAEEGATVLMVTHEPAGGAHADRVVVLKDGRIVGQIDNDGSGDAALVAARCQELAG
jgi:putative ABC transport system ATP-binding protein